MRTELFIIRHGETDWNRESIFRGIYDIPLNEIGRQQARLAAEALAGEQLNAAYTSPLSRAVETAAIVLESHGLTAVPIDGLMDFNYGDWTGLRDDVVAERWPQERAQWMEEPHALHVPGGDTLDEVFQRAFGAMEAIAVEHDGHSVALFAHRVVNKLLILGALGLNLDRFPFILQGNCCINHFIRTDEGYLIERLNDTSHILNAGTSLIEADF
jgi:broad specificity phosphatase PhoE